MNYKKALLASALASTLGFGASNASANVYAHSFLDITEFTVAILESTDGGATFGPAANTITAQSLTLQNTANLNGTPAITIAGCNGTPSSNNCGPSGARLDAAIASLGGAAPAENTFTPQGPAGFEYAWADSIVPTSQLSLDPTGSISAGSESELQDGKAAGSSAELTSTAGITMNFTVGAGTIGALAIDLDAALDNYVEIFPAARLPSSALSDNDVQFQLTPNGNGATSFVSWSPDGSGSGCISSATCTILQDDFDLNDQRSVNQVGASSFNSSGDFQVFIAGLTSGDYSLNLTTTTRTNVTQVPVPGTLMLLGLGLAGLARRLGRKA